MLVVDMPRAVAFSRPALDIWGEARKHPDSPPFSGGVLDAWPAWAVDAMAICRNEEEAIRQYLQSKE